MSSSVQSVAAWHHEVDINGEPYPTRNSAPNHESTSSAYIGDLTDEQSTQMRAVHEAAHAVAALAASGHVHHAKLVPAAQMRAMPDGGVGVESGDVFACNLIEGRDVARFLGAGERAEDRWLREVGLWTPSRAVGVEMGACSDRRSFLGLNPRFGFGIDDHDYRVVHDLADQFIGRHWTAINAVADVLATQLHLTGREIAELAQIPNGTHICISATAD